MCTTKHIKRQKDKRTYSSYLLDTYYIHIIYKVEIRYCSLLELEHKTISGQLPIYS